ncbi:MAG: GNAT family N-acetyltransferase [Gammaproteobacteria bacterium]|nr:GNAT family N-acetyltransferase [Gammaproteobacteria bacterium]
MPELYINHSPHYADFIRLNEAWIAEYFSIEESDRKLAANPGAVIKQGGFILSLADEIDVLGVCALFSIDDNQYELARLAVDKTHLRKGYADRLVSEALGILKKQGATKVSLMSNTILKSALALYLKHGFMIVSEGPHPVYQRTNIVMEKELI